MVWRVESSAAADADLALIFDFLFQAATGFGEAPDRAFEQAARRIRAIEDAIFALGIAPEQGTLMPEILPGLRRVTKQRAIIYFEADKDARTLRVLAVFYGSQDHQRRMLIRQLSDAPAPHPSR
ncbi:MAG: type II toxin-antitoxin system RelE/ParE family toxin [Paracoccus sp. (in: a-proteobacteria)]|uniref:type II toxin-antitoxin system RelE/ParE family toxin n=1 Tax=Paracoccus sp. TaxID=267 RepID=UPI0026E06FC2|nr:type II toxin-antitoxin system RelE/ParE family toxin [Paracoccus sp. (in: a-proteobacteria)]MDO5613681.1 type II toxin-antitoxin system RelE/ParE family toxin [Paracoccus sp. (in: a-proteobacteria)]